VTSHLLLQVALTSICSEGSLLYYCKACHRSLTEFLPPNPTLFPPLGANASYSILVGQSRIFFGRHLSPMLASLMSIHGLGSRHKWFLRVQVLPEARVLQLTVLVQGLCRSSYLPLCECHRTPDQGLRPVRALRPICATRIGNMISRVSQYCTCLPEVSQGGCNLYGGASEWPRRWNPMTTFSHPGRWTSCRDASGSNKLRGETVAPDGALEVAAHHA
jgi:hypothetical protein